MARAGDMRNTVFFLYNAPHLNSNQLRHRHTFHPPSAVNGTGEDDNALADVAPAIPDHHHRHKQGGDQRRHRGIARVLRVNKHTLRWKSSRDSRCGDFFEASITQRVADPLIVVKLRVLTIFH